MSRDINIAILWTIRLKTIQNIIFENINNLANTNVYKVALFKLFFYIKISKGDNLNEFTHLFYAQLGFLQALHKIAIGFMQELMIKYEQNGHY